MARLLHPETSQAFIIIKTHTHHHHLLHAVLARGFEAP
jgi:hypothetical protein